MVVIAYGARSDGYSSSDSCHDLVVCLVSLSLTISLLRSLWEMWEVWLSVEMLASISMALHQEWTLLIIGIVYVFEQVQL